MINIITKKTGLLVPPKDPKALADAVVQLLSNPDLMTNMEINVKKKADDLSWDSIAKKITHLYEEEIR